MSIPDPDYFGEVWEKERLERRAFQLRNRLKSVKSPSPLVEATKDADLKDYVMREIKYKSKEMSPPLPSRSATFCLLMIPKKHRENLIGDLEEEFFEVVLPEYGLKAARRWYAWQVCYSMLAFIGHTVKGIVIFWRTSK